MAHTSEQSARRIITILRNRNVKTGEIGMVAWFNEPFSLGGWTMAEFEEGVKFAAKKGWIVIENDGSMLRLAGHGAHNA
jgi:hypothetical protein